MALQMTVAALTLGGGWALLPLRMAGGILLGPAAVDPSSPVAIVVIAGVLAHVTLSAAFGVLFASIMERDRRRPPRRMLTMVLASLVYGVGLWLINFYVIAPLAGWDWFPKRTNPIAQLVAHALCYAPLVALYLHAVESRPRAVASEPVAAPARMRRAA